MTIDAFMERSGIPLLLCVICVYYAWRLLAMKDIDSVRGKHKPPAKDPENYCKAAGRLILLFALASAVMAFLLLFSPVAAVVEIVAATVAVAVAWKNMDSRFGG